MRTPPLYIRAKVGGGRGAYSARKIGPGIVVPPPFFVFIFPGKRCWFRVRRAHSGVYPDTAGGGGEKGQRHNLSYSPPSPRTTPSSSSCCRANCNQVSGVGATFTEGKTRRKCMGNRVIPKGDYSPLFWGAGVFWNCHAG